jgi:hypothetical protein
MDIYAQEVVSTPEIINFLQSPSPGQALQGIILIEGEYTLDEVSEVELSFSYKDDPRDTWFLINELESPQEQQFSFEWETTTLTDGDYTLRIIVTTDRNQFIDYVTDLRIRNYSAIETVTPIPTSTQASAPIIEATFSPTQTETPESIPATPLPINPAQISTTEIGLSMGRGALIAVSLFAAFGLYQVVRNRRRRH